MTRLIGLGLLFLSSAIALGRPQDGSKPTQVRFCFLSMNSRVEMPELKKFLFNISKDSFAAEEFQNPGTKPEDNLINLIAKNEPCDALILSGHHSGDFWGDSAADKLHLDFLEEQSCSHPEWFSKLKLTFFLGCRSMGASSTRDSDAESHRVMDAIREGRDRGDAGAVDLALGFDDVYDEFDPLSTRHAAIFPYAKLFGFSETAAGAGASENFIPYFFQNVKRLVESKVRRTISLEEAVRFAFGAKTEEKLKLVGQAWEMVGYRGRKFGMKVSDPKKYDDFAWGRGIFLESESTTKEIHKKYLHDRCAFSGKEWTQTQAEALDSILANRDSIVFNFSSIKAALGSSKQRANILARLKRSEDFRNFLKERLNSKHTSLIGRLKLYSVYHQIDSSNAPDPYFSSLLADSLKVLAQPAVNDEIGDIQSAVVEELPLHFEDTTGWLSTQDRRTFTSVALKLIQEQGYGGAVIGRDFGTSLDFSYLASAFEKELKNSQDEKVREKFLDDLGLFAKSNDLPADAYFIGEFVKYHFAKQVPFNWLPNDFVAYAMSTPNRLQTLLALTLGNRNWGYNVFDTMFFNPDQERRQVGKEIMADSTRLRILVSGLDQYYQKYNVEIRMYAAEDLFAAVSDQDIPYLVGQLDSGAANFVAQGLAVLGERAAPTLQKRFYSNPSRQDFVLSVFGMRNDVPLKYLPMTIDGLESPTENVATFASYSTWHFEKNYKPSRDIVLPAIERHVKKTGNCRMVEWMGRFGLDAMNDLIKFYDQGICKNDVLNGLRAIYGKPAWVYDRFVKEASKDGHESILYYLDGRYPSDRLEGYWFLSKKSSYQEYLLEPLVRDFIDKTPDERMAFHKALEKLDRNDLDRRVEGRLFWTRINYEPKKETRLALMMDHLKTSDDIAFVQWGLGLIVKDSYTYQQYEELVSLFVQYTRRGEQDDWRLNHIREIREVLENGLPPAAKDLIKKNILPSDSPQLRKALVAQ